MMNWFRFFGYKQLTNLIKKRNLLHSWRKRWTRKLQQAVEPRLGWHSWACLCVVWSVENSGLGGGTGESAGLTPPGLWQESWDLWAQQTLLCWPLLRGYQEGKWGLGSGRFWLVVCLGRSQRTMKNCVEMWWKTSSLKKILTKYSYEGGYMGNHLKYNVKWRKLNLNQVLWWQLCECECLWIQAG
jgi:hypothetical protein